MWKEHPLRGRGLQDPVSQISSFAYLFKRWNELMTKNDPDSRIRTSASWSYAYKCVAQTRQLAIHVNPHSKVDLADTNSYNPEAL